MFKNEVLDQSGFLLSKKDLASETSAQSAQQHRVRLKEPDLKLWLLDLLTINKCPDQQSADFYSFCGFIVNIVDFYGVVTEVDSNRFGVLYKVDDGTGEIGCWLDYRKKPNKENLRRKVETIMVAIQKSSFDKAIDYEEPPPSTSAHNYNFAKPPRVQAAEWLKSKILSASECNKDLYEMGDTVQVRGKLVDFRGERCIRIYNIHGFNRPDSYRIYVGEKAKQIIAVLNATGSSNNITTQKSTFAEHLLQENHNYKNIEENMKILKIAQKGDIMNSLEDYYIYINKIENPNNMLNITHINNKNAIFEEILQTKS